jgi:tRNA threonylcarbamoyladenosine biosynthesis protein TsaE
MRTLTTHSAEETIQRGRDLAGLTSPPMIVFLSGELGAGKTTLAKGIISGLGVAREEDVTSPTFTLVHLFRSPEQPARKVYHIDLYRIGDKHDLATLGLGDLFDEPSIILVEWPDRLAGLGGRNDWPTVHVHLAHGETDTRTLQVEGL